MNISKILNGEENQITDYRSVRTDRCLGPCDVKINEWADFQCFDCKALFVKNDKSLVKEFLRQQRGELWGHRFKELLLIQKLVKDKNFELLDEITHLYQRNEEDISNIRKYYELRRN